MGNDCPLLSICIPTYNRAKYLADSLERFRIALAGHSYNVELIVSDNHSQDNTEEVVSNAILNGLDCSYFRNDENIGPDRNFLSCFKKSKGKYIWLLGDDDYLIPEKFDFLYNSLREGDFGLVHLIQNTNFSALPKIKTYNDIDEFLGTVHVYITFMSANILRREVVDRIDPNKYMNSYLVQVPYYLESSVSRPSNAIVFEPILEAGKAYSSNGGYNIFQVFVKNLNGILHELVENGSIKKKEYNKIIKDIYYKWLCEYVVDILILKKPNNFHTDNAWSILLKEYWNKPYFYYKTTRRAIGKLLSK